MGPFRRALQQRARKRKDEVNNIEPKIPTKPGWYWVRTSTPYSKNEWEVVIVVKSNFDDSLYFEFEHLLFTVGEADSYGFEWAQPCEPLKPPEA